MLSKRGRVMDGKVEEVYKYVSKMEDLYYSKLKGDGSIADFFMSANAACYQHIRLFIEEMEKK